MRPHFRNLVLIFLLLPAALHAAPESAAATATSAASPTNYALFALMGLVLVLMLAIGILGGVMKTLAHMHMDKMKKEREEGTVAKTLGLLLVFCLLGFTAGAEDLAEAAIAAPPSPFISGIPRGQFYFLTGIIGFEIVVILAQVWMIQGLLKALRPQPQKAPAAELKVRKKNILDIFNKSVSVEHEEGIVLDHDYDGIRELDNSLPPWWKWGFVLTILVSVAYMWYYHVGDGPNQIEEYLAEVQKGEEEKAAYLAKSANNVDENTVTAVLDPVQLDAGKQLYQTNCAACHLADGGGSVGPNLTDDYWLHGGSIKDVFATIKYGVPDKGMKSWKDDFSPKQIASIASYVKTLNGTKPATPKAPQGDLFVEGGDQAIDSISNKTDPSLTPSGEKENKNDPFMTPSERTP